MLLRILPFKSTASLVVSTDFTFDPYFLTNTRSLCHFESLVDEKGNTITNTNVTLDATTFKFGTKSASFNGSDSKLSLPVINTGSSDFTVEFWVYPKSNASLGIMMSSRNTTGWWIQRNADGSVSVADNVSGGNQYMPVAGNRLPLNTWSHVALVCQRSTSGITTLYINGMSVGSSSVALSAETAHLLGTGQFGGYFTGNIDEYRFTSGIARYTSNFTPATNRFSDLNDYDYYWQNTVLLCPLTANPNDELGHTSFGTSGTVTYDLTNPIFAGIPTAYMTNGWFAFTDHEDWTIDQPGGYLGGAYTWEVWVRPDVVTGNQTIFSSLSTSSIGLVMQGNTLVLYLNGSSRLTTTAVMAAATWKHVAVVVQDQVWTIYVNGVSVGTTTFATAIANATGNFGIGIAPGIGNMFTGRMADFRATKGFARYTGTFQVPRVPLPKAPTFDGIFYSNSVLSMFDGTPGATTFVDQSSKAHTYTNAGGCTLSNAQSKSGGTSLAFTTAANSYVTLPSAAWPSGSEDFTIEFWTYVNARSGTNIPFINSPLSGNGFRLYAGPTQLLFTINAANTTAIAINHTFAIGSWVHVAVTRTSGVRYNLYINGVIIGTAYLPDVITAPVPATTRIGSDPSSSDKLNGYIEDLRVTRGFARYTARGSFRTPNTPVLLAPPAA